MVTNISEPWVSASSDKLQTNYSSKDGYAKSRSKVVKIEQIIIIWFSEFGLILEDPVIMKAPSRILDAS